MAADKPGFGCFGAENPLGGQSRVLLATCTLLSSSFPIVNWPESFCCSCVSSSVIGGLPWCSLLSSLQGSASITRVSEGTRLFRAKGMPKRHQSIQGRRRCLGKGIFSAGDGFWAWWGEESSYTKVCWWEQPRRRHPLGLRCDTHQHLPCLPQNKAQVPGNPQRASQQHPFPLAFLGFLNLVSGKRNADLLPHSTCNLKLDL